MTWYFFSGMGYPMGHEAPVSWLAGVQNIEAARKQVAVDYEVSAGVAVDECEALRLKK